MPERNPVAPITTTYPSTGGPHSVATYWNGTETANDWWQRHKDRVRADMLGDFPLVTGA